MTKRYLISAVVDGPDTLCDFIAALGRQGSVSDVKVSKLDDAPFFKIGLGRPLRFAGSGAKAVADTLMELNINLQRPITRKELIDACNDYYTTPQIDYYLRELMYEMEVEKVAHGLYQSSGWEPVQ
jgi:hypothetical protein